MKKIAILGCGAHAAEIEGYILDSNLMVEDKIDIIGYFDDNEDNWKKYQLKFPLLGKIKDFNPNDNVQLILGLANISIRKELISYYLNKGAKFTNFIHHKSHVFDTSSIGVGNVLCKNCVIGPNVIIGDFNTLNTNASIGHDSILGVNNVLCPNVGFSGGTKVGDDNFFSLNSATIPNVVIGSRNVIAPNMVIEKIIKDDTTVFYRFKEKILFQPK